VRGRAVDAVNHGRLEPKGLHGWEANNSPDRLKRPLIRRNGTLVDASWDEAPVPSYWQTERQMSWLITRIKQAAPQALVMAE
jgi:predicted molibdopterin-dependent oxidoreductase YjgC